MAQRGSKTVDSTVNSFGILEELVTAERPLGVTELADAVGLSKGVVHNHLCTLSDLGYVRKADRKYLPSFGVLTLGERVRENVPVFTAARSKVDNLAKATGEVTSLFVEEDGVGVPIYLAPGNETWLPEYVCGERIPLTVNAPGKAILSTFDGERVETVVDERGLPSRTEATVTHRDDLFDELRSVRENGVAFCREEQFEGIVGVAAPISLGERAPAAAVAVCGPAHRLTGRYFEEDVTGQVISTAKSIQVDLTK